MTIEDTNNTQPETPKPDLNYRNTGNILAGLVVILAGTVYLLKNIGIQFPHWVFTWPMLLIVIGIFSGAKHSFRYGGWWVVCLVGLVFLFKDFINDLSISHIIWPILIIFFGLILMFKPRRKRCYDRHYYRYGNYRKYRCAPNQNYNDESNVSNEDFFESISIFGGVKKNIISKNFKGGEIVCIFGGSEINLMQSDFKERVELNVTQVFGGTKLIVPSNWNVVTEMVAILGGIEDKRLKINDFSESNNKVLVLKGTSIFGGIDIRSY